MHGWGFGQELQPCTQQLYDCDGNDGAGGLASWLAGWLMGWSERVGRLGIRMPKHSKNGWIGLTRDPRHFQINGNRSESRGS